MVEETHKPRHELMGKLRGGKSYYNPDSACLNCDMATPRNLHGSPEGGRN